MANLQTPNSFEDLQTFFSLFCVDKLKAQWELTSKLIAFDSERTYSKRVFFEYGIANPPGRGEFQCCTRCFAKQRKSPNKLFGKQSTGRMANVMCRDESSCPKNLPEKPAPTKCIVAFPEMMMLSVQYHFTFAFLPEHCHHCGWNLSPKWNRISIALETAKLTNGHFPGQCALGSLKHGLLR